MNDIAPAPGLETPALDTPVVIRLAGELDGRLALVHHISWSPPLGRNLVWVKLDGSPQLHALGLDRITVPQPGDYTVGGITFSLGGAGFVGWRSDCPVCASMTPDAFAPKHGPRARCEHGGRVHCTGDGCF